MRFSSLLRWQGESAIDYLHEVSFFTENDTFTLRCGEILQRFGIGTKARAVGFVCGEVVERDQSPRDIVRAFVWQEIANQVPAAARNDPPPVFGVGFEFVTLERIDLVANDASDHCVCFLNLKIGGRCWTQSVPPAVAGGWSRNRTHPPATAGGTDCVQVGLITLVAR